MKHDNNINRIQDNPVNMASIYYVIQPHDNLMRQHYYYAHFTVEEWKSWMFINSPEGTKLPIRKAWI